MRDEDSGKGIEKIGGAPSIVEYFSIEGLYGYRNVSLTSKYAATILIAKNGSGKTTLLAALNAFLKCQFVRLADLDFTRIVCKLRGLDELLTLERVDLISVLEVPESSELYAHASTLGLEPGILFDFIENEYPDLRRNFQKLRESETFEAIVAKVGYSSSEARKLCDRISSLISNRNPRLNKLRSDIGSVVSGMEIVYLPTYRRIELPLSSEIDESRRGRRRSVQAKLGISKKSLFSADIQFGLADIAERLSILNQEIVFSSNQGYREISAKIINDLIGGAFDGDNIGLGEIPSKDALALFFSRLKDGRRIVPYADVEIPDIDRIYSGENIPKESNRFLNYFLSKLNAVIRATRDVEVLVEEFVNSCNRYLAAHDEAAYMPPGGIHESNRVFSVDDKALKLDRRNLQVHVESLAIKRKISLDSLSSGEKQMISLFSRLYLYPGKKIVLIDEPELSLSIDWQRKILLDVVGAPSCAQVIAITHSPFVFDNSLEPYAKALTLTIDASAQSSQADDAEDLNA